MKTSRWLLIGTMLLFPTQILAQGPPSKAEFEAERAALFTQADADGNGALSFDEFETFHSLVREKKAEHRFNHLDANGDGSVSLEELQAGRPGPGPCHGPHPWDR
jgi:hypothetical protein